MSLPKDTITVSPAMDTSNSSPSVSTAAIELTISTEQNTIATFNFIFNVCIDGILCLLGYFGNIMTILVLHKDNRRTSNSTLLQALAVLDCMFLTYVVLYVVLRSIHSYTGVLQGYADINAYIVAIVLPFGWTSQTATIWLVMLLAIDRFLIVSYPLKAKIFGRPKTARYSIIIMTIFAVLFNSPRWVHYYFVAFKTGIRSNVTFVSHMSFELEGWNEEIYSKIYHIGLTIVFLFIIPLLVLIILNNKLIINIRKATKSRQAMTQGSSEGKSSSSTNVTRMMVIIISIFILCELPDFIASVIAVAKFEVDPVIYAYYAPVKEMLLVLNSSINFYLYCIFYKQFRQTLRVMLGYSSGNAKPPSTTLQSAIAVETSLASTTDTTTIN